MLTWRANATMEMITSMTGLGAGGLWMTLAVLIALVFALDIRGFRRQPILMHPWVALAWVGFWCAFALAFGLTIYLVHTGTIEAPIPTRMAEYTGREMTIRFLAGYMGEWILSFANLLLIALTLSFFQIPVADQPRFLFWGVLGMVLMRFPALLMGMWWEVTGPVWTIVLAGILMTAGIKMLLTRHDNLHPERNPFLRLVKRVKTGNEIGRPAMELPGESPLGRLTGRQREAWFLILSADVLFAVAAVPMVKPITGDPLIILMTNVASLFGLRAMYFALAGLMHRMRVFKYIIAAVLIFMAVAALAAIWRPWSPLFLLVVMVGLLATGWCFAFFAIPVDSKALVSPIESEIEELAQVTLKQARRIVVLIIGSTTVIIGVFLIVLPGPALVVIPAGFAILSTEFVWARRWLRKFAQGTREFHRRFLQFGKKRETTAEKDA